MLLLMAVCLVAEPKTCREEQIVWSLENAAAIQCMSSAQFAIVEWQASHPAWHVTRWRCVPTSAKKIDI